MPGMSVERAGLDDVLEIGFELGDGAARLGVGVGAERVFALQLQEHGDFFQNGSDFGFVHDAASNGCERSG